MPTLLATSYSKHGPLTAAHVTEKLDLQKGIERTSMINRIKLCT